MRPAATDSKPRRRHLPPVPPPLPVPNPFTTVEYLRRSERWTALLVPGCYWRRPRPNVA
jgi:hypothetical protein